MTMTETTKIGRNDPCRCGSGKKYKRCCLAADETPAVERAREVAVQEAVFARHTAEITALLRSRGLPRTEATLRSVATEIENKAKEIERLCSLTLDEIDARRFDAASDLCDRLERDYPEEVAGLDLRAHLLEAQGDIAAAARTYRRALEFTLTRDYFDDELRNDLRDQITRLEALAPAATSS
jgi:SEC-C motif